jgi:hypothetical protein
MTTATTACYCCTHKLDGSAHLISAQLLFLGEHLTIVVYIDKNDHYLLQGGHGEPSSPRASAHRNVIGGVACTTRQFTQPSRHRGPASSQTTAPEKNLQLSQHLGNWAARRK